jgi:hypothetical protein
MQNEKTNPTAITHPTIHQSSAERQPVAGLTLNPGHPF